MSLAKWLQDNRLGRVWAAINMRARTDGWGKLLGSDHFLETTARLYAFPFYDLPTVQAAADQTGLYGSTVPPEKPLKHLCDHSHVGLISSAMKHT